MIVAVNSIYAIAKRSLKKKKFRTSTGSNPIEVLNFFQASLRNCINCVHCDDHFFIFISFPQFIYDLFHISLSLKISLVNIWICHIYVFFGLKLHETADFVSDLGAYKFKEEALPSGLFVIEVDDLLISSVMHIYKHEGCMYICP